MALTTREQMHILMMRLRMERQEPASEEQKRISEEAAEELRPLFKERLKELDFDTNDTE